MIGLTFMNFPAEDLLPLLKGIAGGSGRVVIASELLTERKTPEVVLNTYRTEEAQLFGFWPLAHLGFQRNEVKCRPIFSNGCVQMCYRLEREPRSPLQARGLRTGDVIVTAVSYRYTKEQLDRLLARHFLSHQVFCSDDAGTAVAVARN
jgi:hypothetical protein